MKWKLQSFLVSQTLRFVSCNESAIKRWLSSELEEIVFSLTHELFMTKHHTVTLTGAASRVLMHHAERFQPLSEEQKALRKGRRGCLDALAIDQAISKERKDREADMSVAWLDIRKAYDLVPHKMIKDALKNCTAPQWVQQLIKAVTPEWKTSVVAWTATCKGSVERRPDLVHPNAIKGRVAQIPVRHKHPWL